MEKNTCSTTAISRKHQGAVPRLIAVSLLLTIIVCVTIGSVPTQAESRPTYKTATFSAGTNPTAAKIGDLDGDGLNDIAVVNLEGSLQLFFNNGAGSFDRVSLNGAWPSNSRIRGVDIGDLNNDGRNDVAVAFSTQTGGISVVLNQGHRPLRVRLHQAVERQQLQLLGVFRPRRDSLAARLFHFEFERLGVIQPAA